jgi:hypothetical protein
MKKKKNGESRKPIPCNEWAIEKEVPSLLEVFSVSLFCLLLSAKMTN